MVDAPVVADSDLTSYLSDGGLEIVDKRPSGGNLWIIGGQGLLIR